MLDVTLYKATGGRTQALSISNVYEEDEKYFKENNIKISMEELNGEFIIYGLHPFCMKKIEL